MRNKKYNEESFALEKDYDKTLTDYIEEWFASDVWDDDVSLHFYKFGRDKL